MSTCSQCGCVLHGNYPHATVRGERWCVTCVERIGARAPRREVRRRGTIAAVCLLIAGLTLIAWLAAELRSSAVRAVAAFESRLITPDAPTHAAPAGADKAGSKERMEKQPASFSDAPAVRDQDVMAPLAPHL